MTTKPILKKKIVVGIQTVPTNNNNLQVDGYIVTEVTFDQKETSYKNLSVTLENGTIVPLEWIRSDRYGKKHQESEATQSGVHPLLKGDNFHGQGLSHAIVKPANDLYVKPEEAPKGFFWWQSWDCGMEKDPERRDLSLRITPEWWNAYKVYRYTEITLEELLSLHSFEEWEILQKQKQSAIQYRLCSKPNGTDGWRW
jgi:hypothetical protein